VQAKRIVSLLAVNASYPNGPTTRAFALTLKHHSPNINDARALRLILLGGVTGRETDGHDWENILRTLGWLNYDHTLAKMSYAIGIILIITALAWGGYILYSQYKNVDEFHR
jgi:hypothetical protein